MKFKKDQIISSGGKSYRILELLGVGGQGEVYLAECEGHQYALKVYIDYPSADFCYNLKKNIERGSPSNSFLWPREIIQTQDFIGYLMDLRPKNYVSFVSYLTGKNKFKDQSALLRWCIELCLSFKKLHEKGYSYQVLWQGERQTVTYTIQTKFSGWREGAKGMENICTVTWEWDAPDGYDGIVLTLHQNDAWPQGKYLYEIDRTGMLLHRP
jgi:serine/threonine protein kinase